MHRSGHIGLALVFTAPFSLIAGMTGARAWMLLIYAPALILALAPDNDVHMPLVKHRGITHTLIFGVPLALLVGTGFGVLAAANSDSPALGIGLGVMAGLAGFASHLVADALTVASGKYGLNPLWPFSNWEFRIGVTKSDSLIWNQSMLLIGVGTVLGVFSLVRTLVTV